MECSRFAAMLIFALLSTISRPQGFNIVMFGDSLSDDGTGYAAFVQVTLRTTEVYPPPPYYNGQASNGPVWIEDAATQLGVTLLDFAEIGATTGSVPGQIPPLFAGFAGLLSATLVLPPNLFQQLDRYDQTTNNSANSVDQYVILIGNNDYGATTSGYNSSANTVVTNIEDAMVSLYQKGARQFILATCPDTSITPAFALAPAALKALVSSKIAMHNELLRELASTFPVLYPGSRVNIFDFEGAVNNAFANPAMLGIRNVTAPCYVTPATTAPGGTLCSNPNVYGFWDQVLPTEVVHAYIGGQFASQFGPSLFGKAPASTGSK